jgi:hypothetical protein
VDYSPISIDIEYSGFYGTVDTGGK